MTRGIADRLAEGARGGLFEHAALALRTADGRLRLWHHGEARLFDLASLTKPLATATLLLQDFARGRCGSQTPIGALLDVAPAARDRTLGELLAHRAGLVPWRDWEAGLSPGPTARAEIRGRVLAETPIEPRGTRRYGDTTYLWLGAALETLDPRPPWIRWTADVALPLGLTDEFAWSPVAIEQRSACAPTGFCPWRGRELRGEVHDPRAAAWGPGAGHAGLFGTAAGVARLVGAWLDALAGRPFPGLPTLAVRWATRFDDGHPPAWDRPGPGPSQAGQLIDPRAFGHLGFTGTSVWADPTRGAVVALLTNRTVGRAEPEAYRRWRPALHDDIWRALDRADTAALDGRPAT